MLCYADGAYTWATAAVRHCKGLVEVEVADVGTDITGVGQTYLCVHICTIHIYLTASIVYGINNLADTALEYSVC